MLESFLPVLLSALFLHLSKLHIAQYYVCPYCDAEIDKINDKATLIAHHSTCPRRVQYQRKIDWERESEIDGLQKMRYILHRILQADADVERLEKKMQDPTISEREKKYLIAQEIDDAKAIKRRELVEKDKLLNHENEITRKAAQKVYDDYLKLSSDYERRKKHYVY